MLGLTFINYTFLWLHLVEDVMPSRCISDLYVVIVIVKVERCKLGIKLINLLLHLVEDVTLSSRCTSGSHLF